jgi:hypothetical protein
MVIAVPAGKTGGGAACATGADAGCDCIAPFGGGAAGPITPFGAGAAAGCAVPVWFGAGAATGAVWPLSSAGFDLHPAIARLRNNALKTIFDLIWIPMAQCAAGALLASDETLQPQSRFPKPTRTKTELLPSLRMPHPRR